MSRSSTTRRWTRSEPLAMEELTHIGKSVAICNGRRMIGPDIRTASVTFSLILIPMVIFFGFSCGIFVDRGLHWVPVIAVILSICSLFFFAVTSMSDPGIIPRQRNTRNSMDRWRLDEAQGFRERPPPQFQDEVINCLPLRVKYCSTCHIYRPPRSVHCSVCDNCVERFDHHCPWVGNCVGRRNYRFFYFFLFSVSLLDTFILAMSILKVYFSVVDSKTEDNTGWSLFWNLWARSTDSLLLIIFCFSICWFVLGLCFYHSYLIITNQTTYEQIKNFYADHRNPWDWGSLGNFLHVVCEKLRPSYITDFAHPKAHGLYEPRDHSDLEMRAFDCSPSNIVVATSENDNNMSSHGDEEQGIRFATTAGHHPIEATIIG